MHNAKRTEVEAAQTLLLDSIKPVNQTIRFPLLKAQGLVTADDVYAPIHSPPFDRSPLDGFALHSEDSAAAQPDNPVRLKITGTVLAGSVFPRPLQRGEAVRIMTGAAMPEGADCMAPKEEVQEKEHCLILSKPVQKGQNYIFKAEEFKRGQLLIETGQRLGAAHLAILAQLGYGSIEVFRPINIAFMSTGDELEPPCEPLKPGKIYNSNETLIAARIAELGFTAKILPLAVDNADTVAAAITANIDNVDIFVTSGAVSVGDKDIMHEVFKILDVDILFWRIACKPGGAALFGILRNKPLACLSGNPFAALANFELLVRPALAKLSHRKDLRLIRKKAYLETAINHSHEHQSNKGSGTRRFLRAKYNWDLASVSLPSNHSSGQLYSFLDCNCFVDIPAGNTALPVGSEVEVLLL